MEAQLRERRMDEEQGGWRWGLVCRVMVACMGEERGWQTGVTGWLPVALG